MKEPHVSRDRVKDNCPNARPNHLDQHYPDQKFWRLPLSLLPAQVKRDLVSGAMQIVRFT